MTEAGWALRMVQKCGTCYQESRNGSRSKTRMVYSQLFNQTPRSLRAQFVGVWR
jgi:hypothetical protein